MANRIALSPRKNLKVAVARGYTYILVYSERNRDDGFAFEEVKESFFFFGSPRAETLPRDV